jgi:hypothetical protein
MPNPEKNGSTEEQRTGEGNVELLYSPVPLAFLCSPVPLMFFGFDMMPAPWSLRGAMPDEAGMRHPSSSRDLSRYFERLHAVETIATRGGDPSLCGVKRSSTVL